MLIEGWFNVCFKLTVFKTRRINIISVSNFLNLMYAICGCNLMLSHHLCLLFRAVLGNWVSKEKLLHKVFFFYNIMVSCEFVYTCFFFKVQLFLILLVGLIKQV